MRHTPYGYRIENGKAVIDEGTSKLVEVLFASYLSGDSLNTAAKKSGIKTSHAGIGNMLKNKRYLGDDFYPAIIDPETYSTVQKERTCRADKLGRIWEKKEEKKKVIPTVFKMIVGNKQYDDPFKQAEYTYSLIEIEVNGIE